ncbi:flagellar biosynthesis protein FlhF [Paenibacillus guangzhouensis]|uniref:flagellar biosynthesis protein FlhF n=1 Tax=Paenibacillus guangzhouensis TaxID=1473112 RepID=UPI001266A7E6|nr:flagellar biosynthesis protein FlhF [Paenibacillus guangzhouensis]
MRVKRYIVETMPTAMQQIRAELGNDAVILSTKDLYIGGFLGMFRKKRIEVVAAVDKAPVPPAKSVDTRQVRSLSTQQNAVDDGAVATLIAAASTASNKHAASAYRSVQSQEIGAIGSVGQPTASSVLVTSHAEPQRPPEPSPIVGIGKPQQGQAVREDLIFDELRQVKESIARLSKQSIGMNEDEVYEPVISLLQEQEIASHVIDTWLDEYKQMLASSEQEGSAEQFATFVRDGMRQQIQSVSPEGIQSHTRVIYVAGPTGVGKTTTIAKLAADQLFRHGRKVGFITSDTYRIAAVEQLRTYATILNIPLEVVNSPADLMRAMKALEHCDLIFMDTAGRNFRNELLVSELNSLLKPLDASETYLVLSLTAKYRDMAKVVEHFQKYQLDKVIFTKLDETGTYGSILNVIHDYHLKLSYITDGQNVPEDIRLLESERIIQLILGEEVHV